MWSVVCFNLGIRSLYVVSRAVGLAPISVNFENFSVQKGDQLISLWSVLLFIPLLIVYPISWYPVSVSSMPHIASLTSGSEHPDESSITGMGNISWTVQYTMGYVVLFMISIMQIGRRRENTVEFLRGIVTLYHKLQSILPNTSSNYQQQRRPPIQTALCKNLVALFLFKSILFEMILLIATWFNLNSHFENTLTLSAFLHSFVTLFPSLLLAILSNGFYGASLLLAFYLMSLNGKLLRIGEKLPSATMLSQSADGDDGKRHRHALHRHHHQLHFSDEIDEIAILYEKVLNYVQKLHMYSTFSVLLIITQSFMNIIVELFLIYLALATEYTNTNYSHIAMELSFVILHYLQIFFVVQASVMIQKQVNCYNL